MRIVLAMLLVSAVACGDDEVSSLVPSRVAAAPKPQPLAKPKPVDLALAPGLEMRRPLRDGNLAIVPIVATAASSDEHYLTLADGLARHEVTVREIGRGASFEVDQVRIRNRSRQPLFVMTGEMIVDGMQDRVIAEDRVIEPGKSVRVSVRCVEMGREAGHLQFHARSTLAELRIRQAVIHETQTEVWASVDAINQHHNLTPSTKTYREVAELQQNPEVVARRDRLAHELAALPERRSLVGLAEVIDGRVVSIERFANAELYGALEAELLGSYIASDDAAPHEGRTFLPDDVRALAAKPGSRMTPASFTAVVHP
jgi:ARG/rhodanese/phosphatase superfamily protein